MELKMMIQSFTDNCRVDPFNIFHKIIKLFVCTWSVYLEDFSFPLKNLDQDLNFVMPVWCQCYSKLDPHLQMK